MKRLVLPLLSLLVASTIASNLLVVEPAQSIRLEVQVVDLKQQSVPELILISM